MKKIFIIILLATSFYTIPMIYANIVNSSTIQVKPTPAYAKWGILAIEKAARKISKCTNYGFFTYRSKCRKSIHDLEIQINFEGK